MFEEKIPGSQDTHAVEGLRFTEGSPIYAERIAESTAALVSQLESKGALVVGKTNVPEFCAGSSAISFRKPKASRGLRDKRSWQKIFRASTKVPRASTHSSLPLFLLGIFVQQQVEVVEVLLLP